MNLPNLLSCSRLLLAIGCGYFIYIEWYQPAGALLLVAVGTDLMDGWLARRWQQTSPLGGLLDHGSDALFVTICLGTLAFHNLVPPLLPILVMASFIQYVLDSEALRGQPLRTSMLGKNNGILYFVLAGFPTLQFALDTYIVPTPWFYMVGWLLSLSSIISMLDRAITLLRLRKGSL